jgi:DNA-directed RNA polymerase subunit L
MTEPHITNIDYPHSNSWDKTKTFVEFDINNHNCALVNSIRRCIIGEVPTLGFRSVPHEKSTINVIQNDSQLHNQIISNRLSMLPIYSPNPDKFPVDDFEFIIDVENNTNFPKDITTNDFKIRIISDNKFLEESKVKEIFPPDPISGNYPLIIRLKPKHYGYSNLKNADITTSLKDEFSQESDNINSNIRFFIKAKAVVSNGKENGHFSPTAVAAYNNRVDPEKMAQGKLDYVEREKQFHMDHGLTIPDDSKLESRFMSLEYKRFYYTDDTDEPSKYRFRLETVGPIPPLVIFYRAIEVLKDKLDLFRTNLLKSSGEQLDTDPIEVSPSPDLLNAMEILIRDENETLGNLLQTYMALLFASYSNPETRKLNYVSYNIPHPLESAVMLVVQPVEEMEFGKLVDTIIMPTCAYISKELDKLQKGLEKTIQYVAEVKSIKGK